MFFTGIFRIIKKLEDTGDITFDSGWVNNTITKQYLRDEVTTSTGQPGSSSSPVDERIGPNIVISEWDGPATEDITHLVQSHAIGTDVAPPQLSGDGLTTPYFVEFQQSYSAPASDRDINTIGMTGETSVPSSGAVQVDAFTKLGTTCTQLTTETLIVFYRVQFLQGTGTKMTALRAQGWARTIGLGTDTENNPSVYFPSTARPYWAANLTEAASIGASNGFDQGYDLTFAYGSSSDGAIFSPSGSETSYDNIYNFTPEPEFFARRYGGSRTVSSEIGAVHGSLLIRSSSRNDEDRAAAYWNNILPENEGKVQNIFSHSALADKPFFDPATIPTTDGTLAIDSSGWTDPDYPHMYRIDITSSGDVGVGEYKFRRRRLVGGLQANTYFNRRGLWGLSSPENTHFKFNGHNIVGDDGSVSGIPTPTTFDNRGETWTVLDERTIIAADDTGVVWLDIINGFSRVFDSEFFPAFMPTAITSVQYDEISNTIWVSCQNTGLYSITDPLGISTVTFHDITTATGGPTVLNNVYAMDLGQDTGSGYRKVFAVAEGALVESTDNGTTWAAYDSASSGKTFTNATIESNWDWVMLLRCDRNNADDQLGIVYTDNTIVVGRPRWVINWWDSVSDSTDPFTSSESLMGETVSLPLSAEDRRRWRNALKVSPNQNRWAWGPTFTSGLPSAFDTGVPIFLTYGQGDSGITAVDTSSVISLNNSYTSNVTGHQPWFEIDDNGDDSLVTILNNSDVIFIRNGGTFFTFENIGVTDPGLFGDVTFSDDFVKGYFGYGIFIGIQSSAQGSILQLSGATNDLPLGPAGWEHILWETYGWDGASWVLDDPGSKTIHAAAEALIDGLTISFDDDGGSQTFNATDYFTTGVVDGVWLDGQSEYDYATTIYTRRVIDNQTDFDPGVIPVSTSLSSAPQLIEPKVADWVDVGVNTDVFDNRIERSTTTGVGGARLNLPSEEDTTLRFSSFTDSSDADNISFGNGTVVGLTSAGTIGSGLDIDTVGYGFYFSGGSSLIVDIHIRESGVNVATIETGFDMNAVLNGVTFRITRNGTDMEYYFNEKLVHTTGSVPGGNMIAEIVHDGSEGEFQVDEWKASWTDTWSYVGDSGGSTGFFDPNYVVTDAGNHFSLEINGVEGTQLLRDSTTVLSAGEYSFFPETGGIRFAAADAGLAITGVFNYLVNN